MKQLLTASALAAGLVAGAAQASGYSVVAKASATAGNVYDAGSGSCTYGVNGHGGLCSTGQAFYGGVGTATINPTGGDTSARSVTATVSGSGAAATAVSKVTADLASASIHLYGADTGLTQNGSSQSTPYGSTNQGASLADTLHFSVNGANANTVTTITGIFTLEGEMHPVGGNVDSPNSAFGEIYGDLIFGATPSRFDLKNNVDTGFVTTVNYLDNYPSGITPSTWTTNADHTVNVSTFTYSFTGPSSDAAFSLDATLQCGNGFVCDFGNTAKFALVLPAGAEFTSDSGVFLSGAATGGVPEPASWALMIIGFGGAGAALRRRRSFVAA